MAYISYALLVLFSGTEVNSSEQTKVVSAAESAPDEHVQGTFYTHSPTRVPQFWAQMRKVEHYLLLFFNVISTSFRHYA
jgi:hypothetical protein